MEIECGDVKTANGTAACLVCCGEHAFLLKLSGCTTSDFQSYCSARPSPSPPTPTPPTPSGPSPGPPGPAPPSPYSSQCKRCVAQDMVWCYHDDFCYEHGDSDDKKPYSFIGTWRCAAEDCSCTSCDDPRCWNKIPNAESCAPMAACGTLNQFCPPTKEGSTGSGLCCQGDGSELKWIPGVCNETASASPAASAANAPAPRGKLFVQGRNARKMLSEGGWAVVDRPEDAELIWVVNRCHLGAYTPRPGAQLLNLLPWDQPMTDKALLVKTLKAYDAHPTVDGTAAVGAVGNSSTFTALTFYLNSRAQREEFASEIERCERARSAIRGTCNEPWILKRTDLSNGEGATIVASPNSSWVRGPAVANLTAAGNRWIAQRYIRNPLLLDGRKSELRVYWLVASLKPLIVLYNTGTVRLNAAKYVAGDYGNDLVHITNTRRQLQNGSLGTAAVKNHGSSLGLKWNHSKLAADLEVRFGKGTWETIQQKIKLIIKRTVFAAREELTVSVGNTTGTFQLFGADFIVDATLNPYLTEIQTGPGLSHDDPVKAAIMPRVLNEAAQLAFDVHRLKTSGSGSNSSGGGLRNIGAELTMFETLVNEA